MSLLSALYGQITEARNALYDRKVLRARRLTWPVISVGNISAGGSGKTPFVIALGELLARRGIWIDVLSRGYGRSTRGVLMVNADGAAQQFGDEPLLIARKLRCPVFVGEERHAAGVAAEREYPGAASNPVHLLDDGFQHRQLHRDFSIVMLNEEDLDDQLLPTGRLREPLSALQRADALVVSETFPLDRLSKFNGQVWRVRRRMELPAISEPVIAFCGIARPQRFFSGLRAAGLDVREEIKFRDHHRYTDIGIERLMALRVRHKNARLVTTEKDAVNLGPHLSSLNPIVVALTIELLEPESAVSYLLGVMAERRGCRA
jgi:tetraacyldisaccharide 4'-kinase